MKKLFMLLAAGAMTFGLAACSDDDTTEPGGNITTADKLFLPRDGMEILLEKGNTVHFEWGNSKATGSGYVTYEVVFDTEDGDFSSPIYAYRSDNNGLEASVALESSTLNTIATLAGAGIGETAKVKWTVRAYCGLSSEVYEGFRTVSITRIYTVDPQPTEVVLTGDACDEKTDVTLAKARPVNTVKGKITQVRYEEGAFEGYAKFKASKLEITDEYGRYFRLGDKNKIGMISDEESDKSGYEVSSPGIYYVYLNFANMTYSLKKIDKVEFRHSGGWWADLIEYAEMKYDGNGVWSLTDYAWNLAINPDPNDPRVDSRYHFICTFADGSKEHWSHFEDDCRENAFAEDQKSSLFYVVFRFSDAVYASDSDTHSWKTNETTKEGLGGTISCTLNMNGEHEGLFWHERSLTGNIPEPEPEPTPGDPIDLADGENLFITGNGTDAGQQVKKIDDDNYEIYTQIEGGGSYAFYSELSGKKRNFYINEESQLCETNEAGKTSTLEAGIYRFKMTLSTAVVKIDKIDKIGLYGCWDDNFMPLAYAGKGVWKKENFNVQFGNGGGDDRYKIVIQRADGVFEHWGTELNNTNPRPSISDAAHRNIVAMTKATTTTKDGQWSGHEYKWPTELNNGDVCTVTIYLDAAHNPYTHEFTDYE